MSLLWEVFYNAIFDRKIHDFWSEDPSIKWICCCRDPFKNRLNWKLSKLKVLKMKVAWMMPTTINKSMHRIKVIFQVLLNLENDCQEDQFYDSGHGVEVLQIVSSDWVRQVSGTLSQQESLFIHISKMSIVWFDINHVLNGFGYFFGNVSETSTYILTWKEETFW